MSDMNALRTVRREIPGMGAETPNARGLVAVNLENCRNLLELREKLLTINRRLAMPAAVEQKISERGAEAPAPNDLGTLAAQTEDLIMNCINLAHRALETLG